MRIGPRLGAALAIAILAVGGLAGGIAPEARAAQTFPDPFAGEGTFTDIRSGAKGEDVGDAFFLREGATFRVRLFLMLPATITESHVCLSAQPFTGRIPPGQCQFQASGAASASYDLTLPPTGFPGGTVPFTDPLGAFCAQVHVAYNAPNLAVTTRGGGSAFAGWQPGSPFYGNICFAEEGPPEPPGPVLDIDKSGSFDSVEGTVTFTVLVTNGGSSAATNVTVLDWLHPELTWQVPEGCTLAEDVATCTVADIPASGNTELTFVGTPVGGFCGTVENRAGALVGTVRSSLSHTAVVEIPCSPQQPDPQMLLDKVPDATSVTVPATVVFLVTLENVGPGDALDVAFTDELPAGPAWSIGSGSNVCAIVGLTLSCAVPVVPDGVFEVIEIIGAVDGSTCGTLENNAAVTWSGGPLPGSATAVSASVEVVGCELPPSEEPPTTDEAAPTEAATMSPDSGELPDTAAGRVDLSGLAALAAAALLLGCIGARLVRTNPPI